jgi:predicted peptidase
MRSGWVNFTPLCLYGRDSVSIFTPNSCLRSYPSMALPIDPGHAYAKTSHISFQFFKQGTSPAPLRYEFFVSLPPSYNSSSEQLWPLVLFLHGAGESQKGPHESFASLGHGVPKIILCYDRLKSGDPNPHIVIPPPERKKARKATNTAEDLSSQPVDPEVCEIVAEEFITVSLSLDARNGYGWNAKILTALLDEIITGYRADVNRIHTTGFSMGGYGTWRLGLETPKRFATLMPVCGGGDPSLAKNLKDMTQW